MVRNTNNLKESPVMQAWNVIYPVLIYYVVINLAAYAVSMLVMLFTGGFEGYYMVVQTAAAALSLPFLLRFYNQDRRKPTAYWSCLTQAYTEKGRGKKAVNGILMFLLGITAGTALNNLIALTGLEQISQGYQEVNQRFFSGDVLFELLGLCFMMPLLEEVVYRGIVYPRLCDFMAADPAGSTPGVRQGSGKRRFLAMVMSGIIFGAMHMNLVQFLYAALLGVLLAWMLDRSGRLYGAALAHMGANLLAVLRVETRLLAWMEQGKMAFALSTAVLLAVSALLWWMIWRGNRGSHI